MKTSDKTNSSVKFVESKTPNLRRVAELLELCRSDNHWANRGPLYYKLAENYAAHFSLAPSRSVTPCANAGIALEAMARLHEQQNGKPLRWVGSAFSFQNLGRGYFADMAFVDCTPNGLLDLDQVRALPEESFDGIIVVNPFGLFTDFTIYIEYAKATGKALLIDNAAGVSDSIPDWPWQAFSLHHTKPYGMGEGGLALTPSDDAEELYALLNYGSVPERPAAWLNNGKISDIACAYLIDRLEQAEHWVPRYHAQAERVHRIARDAGLTPIRPFSAAPPAMSWAFTAEGEITIDQIMTTRHATLAKYYKPLRPLPCTIDLFAKLVNVPTHPNMAWVSDADLFAELKELLTIRNSQRGHYNG